MLESLSAILRRSERELSILHADEVATWPEGDLERWVAGGVLEPASPTAALSCPGCGDHSEVVFLDGVRGARAYLTCSACGPSRISADRMRRWCIAIERLAETALADIVPLPQPVCLESGRLWRIGKAAGEGGRFPVYLGRQLHRADTMTILARSGIPSKAVVFAPLHLPPCVAKPGPLILPLREVLRYADGHLDCDRPQVLDRLTEWCESHTPSTRPPAHKRAGRAADIAALSRELQEHVRAARDFARATHDRTGLPRLFPRPTQQELARRTGASQWTVSRCLNDPEARELSYLWELAADLDRLLGFDPS